jgi:hypothetical protein
MKIDVAISYDMLVRIKRKPSHYYHEGIRIDLSAGFVILLTEVEILIMIGYLENAWSIWVLKKRTSSSEDAKVVAGVKFHSVYQIRHNKERQELPKRLF